jgi:hypothetical protein
VFIRLENAQRFIEEVRGDVPELRVLADRGTTRWAELTRVLRHSDSRS